MVLEYMYVKVVLHVHHLNILFFKRWVKFDPLGQFLYTGIANNTTVRPPSRVSFIR